jgi:hypothetical protein
MQDRENECLSENALKVENASRFAYPLRWTYRDVGLISLRGWPDQRAAAADRKNERRVLKAFLQDSYIVD